MKIKLFIASLLIGILFILVGCVPSDANGLGNMYTNNIYPNVTNLYNSGSSTYAWNNMYSYNYNWWNGSAWVTLSSGGVPSLTDSHIFVGNALNVATDVPAGGDVSLANTGAFTVIGIQGHSVTLPLSTGYLQYNPAAGGSWSFGTGGGGLTSVDTGVPSNVTGILTGNGSVIGSITDNHTNWDTAYSDRITSATGSGVLTLGLAANALTGSVDLSSVVPYSGATGAVNLGANGLTANNLTDSALSSGDLVGAGTGGLLQNALAYSGSTITGSVTGNAGTVTGLSVTSGKTLTVDDSDTLNTNSITLGGGEVITFSATNALSLLTTAGTSVTLPTSGTLVSSVTAGNGVSATNTAGALAFTLGVITPTSVNGLTLASASTGFTIAGGTTSKTLTMNDNLTAPTIGGAGYLYQNGSGTFSWATPTLTSMAWSALTAPTGALAMTMPAADTSTFTCQATTQTPFAFTSSTLTTGGLISLASTSTALATNTGLLNISLSGANGSNAVVATGANISVTNTNVTSGTNIGLNLVASGATTNNYALQLSGGNINIASAVTILTPTTLTINGFTLGGSLNANSNTLTGATSYNGLVITANTGAITTGAWNGSLITGQYGGTGVANTGDTITLGGNLTTTLNAITLATTGATSITLPTTGTLSTLAGAETLSNKTLTTPILASLYPAASTTQIQQETFTTGSASLTSTYEVYGTHWDAQLFTPLTSYTMNAAAIQIYSINGSQVSSTLALYASSASLPTGSALASGTFTPAAGWQTVTFSTPYAITVGTSYDIVMSNPSGSSSVYFIPEGVVSGGVGFAYETSANSWNAKSGYQANYECFGQPALISVSDAAQTQTLQTYVPPLYFSTVFETSTRFGHAGNTPTFGTAGVTLNTGATSNYSEITCPICSASTFNAYASNPQFGFSINVGTLGTDTQQIYCLGEPTIAAGGVTYTNAHIGFKIIRVSSGTCSLYATQADGTTENASSALTTLVASDTLELICQVNGQVNGQGSPSVNYYWAKDGGMMSAATNLTSNMPSSAAEYEFTLGVSNVTVATTDITFLTYLSYSRN